MKQDKKVSRRALLEGIAGLATVPFLIGTLVKLAPSISKNFISSVQTPTPTPTHTATPTPTHTATPTPTRTSTITSFHPGDVMHVYRGHKNNVNGLAWSLDSRRIASGSFDGTVQLWDATTGDNLIYVFNDRTKTVNDVAWSNDGNFIGFCADNQVYVWSLKTGKLTLLPIKHTKNANALTWSPYNLQSPHQYIASASYDGTVQVCEWDGHKELGRFSFSYTNEDKAPIFTVAWSPINTYNYIAVSSFGSDATVQMFGGTTGKITNEYRDQDGNILSIAWAYPKSASNSSDPLIASGSTDTTVNVWGANTVFTYTYTSHTDAVRRVSWSPDDKRIASGCENGELHVWDALTGAHMLRYQDHQRGIYALAWSPNGQMIASGGNDNLVRIWQAG